MWRRLLSPNTKTNPLSFQAGAFPAGMSSSSQRLQSAIQACVLGIGQGKWLLFQASACLLHPLLPGLQPVQSAGSGRNVPNNPVFCPPLVPSIPPPPRGKSTSLVSSLSHLQPISILIQSPSASFSTSTFLSLIYLSSIYYLSIDGLSMYLFMYLLSIIYQLSINQSSRYLSKYLSINHLGIYYLSLSIYHLIQKSRFGRVLLITSLIKPLMTAH